MFKYLLLLYGIVSVIALFAYAWDKSKAKKGKWRTPETVLLGLGLFGGAVGALIGMNLFHHKTKHWYFWIVNILGLVWQLALPIFVALG